MGAHRVFPGTTWLDVCRIFAEGRGLPESAVEPLACFAAADPRGGPPAPPEREASRGFEALEREVGGALRVPDLPTIDPAQAAMFARRLRTVDRLLEGLGGPEGRLLRVGLRVRLEGIAASGPPRALRARALADFYYSLGVAARHRAEGGDRLPSVVAAIREAPWRDLGGGLRLGRLDGLHREGPQHIHVLEVDPRRVRIRAADVRGEAGPFAAMVARHGARAGTSGGFFLYSEPDIEPPSARYDPVGLLVSGGRVLSPPVLRRGSLLVGEGTALRRVGPEGWSIVVDGVRRGVTRAWNRADGRAGPDEASVAIVGDRVVATGRALDVPLHGVVVPWTGGRVGATVTWEPPEPLAAAMAGGPILRAGGVPTLDHRAEDFHGSAPPRTFSQDETGDRNLLPRLAVGRRRDGVLLFAAIDGRNLHRALGATLRTTGELLGALGCDDVLNLDGGSSKRMVVDGVAVDLSSTEVRGEGDGPAPVRPVHTALLFG